MTFESLRDHGVPQGGIVGTVAQIAGASCTDGSIREHLTCVPPILVTLSRM
jgi:hypothetical protein